MRNMESFSHFSFPRAAGIYDACLELFSRNREHAWEWLTSPVRSFGYARPIDYAKTEAGGMKPDRAPSARSLLVISEALLHASAITSGTKICSRY
jgi:hypothetical protein